MARILVIDDSALIRETLASCLPSLGHMVLVAPDGESGLAKADPAWVDLVLLDVELPRMSGLTVCQILKADEDRRIIPVVMMTGRPTAEIRRQAAGAGAANLLVKPFALGQLAEEIDRHLAVRS